METLMVYTCCEARCCVTFSLISCLHKLLCSINKYLMCKISQYAGYLSFQELTCPVRGTNSGLICRRSKKLNEKKLPLYLYFSKTVRIEN
ncbi:unnamed protein product [Moneuplotes crassus]|uniref:Uncharacterized protein n=1 Tax=Euplotes crassus TaxID=5936 RepID=A0AAD1Y1D1_EUPCR|nr:unnamed protein product [Moneuplotes crassus]